MVKSSFIRIVYFLAHTADKEIYNIFNSFSIPLILEYKPDKQTYKSSIS